MHVEVTVQVLFPDRFSGVGLVGVFHLLCAFYMWKIPAKKFFSNNDYWNLWLLYGGWTTHRLNMYVRLYRLGRVVFLWPIFYWWIFKSSIRVLGIGLLISKANRNFLYLLKTILFFNPFFLIPFKLFVTLNSILSFIVFLLSGVCSVFFRYFFYFLPFQFDAIVFGLFNNWVQLSMIC